MFIRIVIQFSVLERSVCPDAVRQSIYFPAVIAGLHLQILDRIYIPCFIGRNSTGDQFHPDSVLFAADAADREQFRRVIKALQIAVKDRIFGKINSLHSRIVFSRSENYQAERIRHQLPVIDPSDIQFAPLILRSLSIARIRQDGKGDLTHFAVICHRDAVYLVTQRPGEGQLLLHGLQDGRRLISPFILCKDSCIAPVLLGPFNHKAIQLIIAPPEAVFFRPGGHLIIRDTDRIQRDVYGPVTFKDPVGNDDRRNKLHLFRVFRLTVEHMFSPLGPSVTVSVPAQRGIIIIDFPEGLPCHRTGNVHTARGRAAIVQVNNVPACVVKLHMQLAVDPADAAQAHIPEQRDIQRFSVIEHLQVFRRLGTAVFSLYIGKGSPFLCTAVFFQQGQKIDPAAVFHSEITVSNLKASAG